MSSRFVRNGGREVAVVSVGVRELKDRTSQIIRAVRQGRAEYVVTVQGRPVAVIVPVETNGDDWEDDLIVNHPYFVERLRKAREAIARSEAVTHQEILADLEQRKRAAKRPVASRKRARVKAEPQRPIPAARTQIAQTSSTSGSRANCRSD